MKNFDNEIKKIAEQFKREPIFDGIVDEKQYFNSKVKILWILKDANSTGEDGAWDMREHISKNIKTDSGILKGWSKTFKRLIYVTNGIINNLSWNDELRHPSSKPEVIDELKKIAYINIKKTGGGAHAIENEIKEYYEFSKQLLFDQINEFDSDIVIFGGTYKYFKIDLKLDQLIDFGTCKAINRKGKIFIDAKHPNARISEEVYFNDILKAVKYF